MPAVWRIVFVTLYFSVCASAQTRTLAVYQETTGRLDSAAVYELQHEVQRLLADASIDVVWLHVERPESDGRFNNSAVASFNGDCSAAELPPLHPASLSSGVFADTDLDKQGVVQPFFHVNCAEVIRRIRPSLDRLSPPLRSAILGRALGRIVAHEIYHVVAQTTDHAEAGAAKPSFSLQDLMAERFGFDSASLQRLRFRPQPMARREQGRMQAAASGDASPLHTPMLP